MSEEELLKKYGCNSLSEFIDTYLDCETAFDLLRSQFKEIERLNNKEEQLIRKLEDLIIVGEQVENEWVVDICKMVIKELKGSDKE